MGWIRRLRGTLAGSKIDDEFDEEARFHLEQRIEEYVARGMTAAEARREASRRLGNLTLARERARDADTLPWLRDVQQDLRYAARQLVRNPGFACVAILTLAIGIAANTALFGIIDELLLKQLPVRNPHELVLFNGLEGRKGMRFGMDGSRTTDAATGQSTSSSFSYPTFLHLRQTNQTLAELFAFYPIQQLNVIVDGNAEIASGQYVSGNYFQGLGVDAALGRTITAADDLPGAPLVATITHQYWSRRFGLDPRIVGQTVVVNRMAFTVVGVTPRGFSGALNVTQSPDVTLPFAAEPLLEGRGSGLQRPAFLWVRVMGRLAPGATREQAAASLNAAMQESMLVEWRQAASAREGGGSDSNRTLEDASSLRAEPGGQGLMDLRRRYAQPLWVLVGCGALVLFTACLNVANLLLSRAAARQREIAVRLALGARRGRLVRQLFTESLLIAIAGSAAALPLAAWGTDLLLIWRPWGGGPVLLQHTLDWRVLGFCGVAAICTALLSGVAPALRATGAAISQVTTRTPGGGASAPLARALIVAQVAITLVLLVAAGLFVSTLRNLRAVEMGFNADRLLLFRVQPQLNGYAPPEAAALYERMIERIETIPGVRSAALSRHPLLSFSHRSDSVSIENAPASSGHGAEINVVAPGFFRTLEIPVLLGRTFDQRDSAGSPRVAVVNQLFAKTHFGVSSPIGHRLWVGRANSGEPIEIVGMTRDAKYTDLRSPTRPAVYVPFQQDVPGQANFEVRTVGDALALAPAVRQAVRDIDPSLPLFEVKSQTDQAQESMARETMFARVSTLFGSIAVLLAAIGLYGTMSYAVVRRTAEIGVRMALGAERGAVVRMVLRDAVALAGIGVAIGIPAALAVVHVSRQVLEQLLFGLGPKDPLALGGAAAILLFVAILAGVLPARRASRVDPMVALQRD